MIRDSQAESNTLGVHHCRMRQSPRFPSFHFGWKKLGGAKQTPNLKMYKSSILRRTNFINKMPYKIPSILGMSRRMPGSFKWRTSEAKPWSGPGPCDDIFAPQIWPWTVNKPSNPDGNHWKPPGFSDPTGKWWFVWFVFSGFRLTELFASFKNLEKLTVPDESMSTWSDTKACWVFPSFRLQMPHYSYFGFCCHWRSFIEVSSFRIFSYFLLRASHGLSSGDPFGWFLGPTSLREHQLMLLMCKGVAHPADCPACVEAAWAKDVGQVLREAMISWIAFVTDFDVFEPDSAWNNHDMKFLLYDPILAFLIWSHYRRTRPESRPVQSDRYSTSI